MPGSSIRARLEAYLRSHAAPPPGHRDEVYLSIAELLRRSERDGAPVSLDLTPYELKVFSQNGEDGVLDEILRRVGTQSRTFAEFGAGPGTEAVCVYLADVARWHGHFIESDPELYRSLAAKYESNDLVTATEALVTPPTVEELFSRIGVPDALDVLCIDIDGHDYWVWKALEDYRPRVVVIEYNAHLGTRSVTIPLGSDPAWDQTDLLRRIDRGAVQAREPEGIPTRALRPHGRQRLLRPRGPRRALFGPGAGGLASAQLLPARSAVAARRRGVARRVGLASLAR